MININMEIARLMKYGLDKNLIEREDVIFTRNKILFILGLDTYKELALELLTYNNIEEILEGILDWAVANKVIENTITEREILDSNIMGAFVKRPSDLIKDFYNLYEESSKKATDYFYKFSGDTNYIRRERIKKDLKWTTTTEFGNLDITINMSKPEKDPIEIEKALKMPQGEYPKCLLCKECEGYAGRLNYPSRSNHRLISVSLNNAEWFFQYSPYVYFNEHSIVLRNEHIPMLINKDTFIELLEFVDSFKHYFIGSNADLPIVGGSILTHDHYQSGNYKFALDYAKEIQHYKIKGFEEVSVSRLKWPLTVIRTKCANRVKLVELADMILKNWRTYSDESIEIFASTDEEAHNTITPIARFKDGMFELDLVLRNNKRTEEHPFGIYHPHIELHHIKKENIGLIEVMGLAVLPARLNKEIEIMKEYLLGDEDKINQLVSHEKWIKEIVKKRDVNIENVDYIIKEEIGLVFLEVLMHCGVFKLDDSGQKAFNKFMSVLV
ncbi:MAG: UDP-glucose--hexose-1-phosphate uridylyltransferase [Sarcina sp.]